MKKILLLVILIGCVESLCAQKYKAELNTKLNYAKNPFFNSFLPVGYYLEVQLVFKNDHHLAIISKNNPVTNGETLHGEVLFDAQKIPIGIRTKRHYQTYHSSFFQDIVGGGSTNNHVDETYTGISYCENRGGALFLHAKEFQLKIYPEVEILPPTNNLNARIIPDNAPVELKATPGFPADVYKWQYRTDETTWSPIPNAEGKSTLSFTGYELLSETFDELYNNKKNIFFRIAPCEGFQTDIVTATLKLSAPHIVSIEPIPTTCFGERNGSVHIQFDRALKPNERLSFNLEGKSNNYSKDNIETLDSNNSFIWDQELAPDTYSLQLIGKINQESTYTDAPSHTSTFTIESPEPVQFATTPKHVNCHEGNDGQINVKASGGVGNYTLSYKKKEEQQYQSLTFDSKEYTLQNLTKGTYQIRLQDANGCIMKDKKDREIIKEVIINQPTTPVTIDYSEKKNPLAFGYTDGSITVIIKGGTPIDGTSYNVVWKNSDGQTLTTVTNKTNPFITTLDNVGKGTYTLSITDANYASTPIAASQGCIVETSFSLEEPPKLEVAVVEDHFVSCKAMQDGALKAIAAGGIPIKNKNYIYEWFKQDGELWTPLKSKEAIAKKLATGIYKVKITDANGITKESEPFYLVEPEVLAVKLVSSASLCSGSTTGHITATITGGTLPYHIQWNTGKTFTTNSSDTALDNLLAGNYHINITDARGCRTEGFISVTTPNPLELKNTRVTQPTCSGGFDGSIHFTAGGGTPPYRYTWQNIPDKQVIDAATWSKTGDNPTLTNLCAGTYSLLLTDSQNCSLKQDFVLDNPTALKIDLGPDRTLCTDQVWIADAQIYDAKATYQWEGPNGFNAQTGVVTLVKEGTYSVLATDSKGCQASDAITIKRDDTVIKAEYSASSHAFIDESIIFINSQDSTPGDIQWIIPNHPSIRVLNQNKKVLELAFSQTGAYEVGIRTALGNCEKIFTKTLTISDREDSYTPSVDQRNTFIKTFKVGPNPNDGNFTVRVELEHVAPITLQLIHLQTGATINLTREAGSDHYTTTFNLTNHKGIYALVLETAKENRIFKIDIK